MLRVKSTINFEMDTYAPRLANCIYGIKYFIASH